MNSDDIPSWCPVASAAPTRISQIQRVRRQHHERDADVQRRRVPRDGVAEDPMKGGGDDDRDRGQQHHGGVAPRPGGVVLLDAITKSAEQEGDAERQQEIREQRADERSPHHLDQPRPQGHHRDDELRQIAEGRVEQSAERRTGARGQLLGGVDDEHRERHDRERGAEEQQRRGGAHRLQPDGERYGDQEPVDRPAHRVDSLGRDSRWKRSASIRFRRGERRRMDADFMLWKGNR